MRGLGIRHGGQPLATVALGTVSVAVFFLTHDLVRVLSFTRRSLNDSASSDYSTFGRL